MQQVFDFIRLWFAYGVASIHPLCILAVGYDRIVAITEPVKYAAGSGVYLTLAFIISPAFHLYFP